MTNGYWGKLIFVGDRGPALRGVGCDGKLGRLGAVLGSKRLKAVAARGKARPPLASAGAIKAAAGRLTR